MEQNLILCDIDVIIDFLDQSQQRHPQTKKIIDEKISRQAFNLLNKYNLEFGLLIPDCFIASTSLSSGFELFTYDVKDYQFIKNLKFFTP
jgi:predicted nucleic acid-binding protein